MLFIAGRLDALALKHGADPKAVVAAITGNVALGRDFSSVG